MKPVPRPRSARMLRRSDVRTLAMSASTVATKLTSALSSKLPLRRAGMTFVPRRFHSSGGTEPVSRMVFVAVSGGSGGPTVPPSPTSTPGSELGPGLGPTSGVGSAPDVGAAAPPSGFAVGPKAGSGVLTGALSACASSLVSRKTPCSKVTSSELIGSSNQTRP